MKKEKTILLSFLILCLGMAAIIVISIQSGKKEIRFSDAYIMTEELAPLLSFTYYGKEEWQEQLSQFADGKLSYHEMEALLDYMGIREYVTYESGAGFQTVPRAVFFQVYEQIVDLLDVDGRVTVQDRVFLGEELKEGRWLTQKGYESIEGESAYISQYDMYQTYVLDDAVIGFIKPLETSVMWENVFIHTAGEGKAEVLFEKEQMTIEIPTLEEHIDNTICDMEWVQGSISAIYKKEDTIQGTVLAYNEDKIEISGYGSLNHSGELKVYKTYGTVEQLDESKLIIGNLEADFVVAKKEVCGIILKEPAKIQQIRVLLLNGTYPYYPEIYLKADEEMTITIEERQQKAAAGTQIKVSDYWKEETEGYLRLDTATEEGRVYLVNEQGELLSLGYVGGLEVRKYMEGYCLVNDVSLEEYLCGVVPSEMPATYEMEALRAQAVCARSYACIQLTNGEYAKFGANVDDSTNYQVYNKQAENEKTTLAVRDTVGEVLKYRDDVAEAYYYSTSCGFSQNVDVWNFPADEAYGYLYSTSLLTGEEQPDVSEETVFAEFIESKDYAAYDSDTPYFRWQAELDTSGLLEAVWQAVGERQKASADNVQIFDMDGNPWNSDYEMLGAITQIQPEERSAGGVLKTLRITCEHGSVLLVTEYNIRRILGAAATAMTDKDGNAISSMSLLPSAAFTVASTENGYTLYGGGYGHGIGMSQNGANGMAKAGFTYIDILQKFYQNITIENIYNEQKEE